MTDLSDLDIARLRKDAKELSQITHSGRPDLSCGKGCKYLYYHQSCAVLALIERLEKAEAQRDRFLDDLKFAVRKLGPWLSAVSEDQHVCQAFKDVVNDWFERNARMIQSELENKTDE